MERLPQRMLPGEVMRTRLTAAVLATSLAFAALPGSAQAGGFAIREQSASAQGSSFAGSASAFDLSSMFWNPAAVTSKSGFNSETHATVIYGSQEFTAESGSLTGLSALGLSTESGNTASPALVASGYYNYQVSKDLYLGLSISAPFGLTTKPENAWVGQSLGTTSKLTTINASPTVGFKLAPGISIAAGVQVQYIKARLTSDLTGLGRAASYLVVTGDDIGYGFTAGVLFEPARGTKIGLGFRSSVSHKLKGEQESNVGTSAIQAEVDLPELVTLSLRQAVSERLTLLGTVEWTNWSRVKQIAINCSEVGGACVANGQTLNTLSLNYEDGWFFAAGLEYRYSPALLLRTGLAYEKSPAQEDTSRTVRISDNNRVWLSAGLTYNWSQATSLDFGYTHIFVEDGKAAQGTSLTSSVESHVDIVAVSLKMKFGGPSRPSSYK